ADNDPATVAEAAKRFPRARTFHNLEAMLDAEKPDCVDIVTPQNTHLELVRSAAERQISAVICQKPLAPGWNEAVRWSRLRKEQEHSSSFTKTSDSCRGFVKLSKWSITVRSVHHYISPSCCVRETARGPTPISIVSPISGPCRGFLFMKPAFTLSTFSDTCSARLPASLLG